MCPSLCQRGNPELTSGFRSVSIRKKVRCFWSGCAAAGNVHQSETVEARSTQALVGSLYERIVEDELSSTCIVTQSTGKVVGKFNTVVAVSVGYCK
jgi:hypothetical protein